MRGLVLWLFADLIFRLNNFIETIGFLLSLALIAPRHPFVAGRQHLSLILLPVIESCGGGGGFGVRVGGRGV